MQANTPLGNTPGPVPAPTPAPAPAPAPNPPSVLPAANGLTPLNGVKDDWNKTANEMKSNLAEMASLLIQMRTLLQELKDFLVSPPNTDIDNVLKMIDASHIRQNDFYDSIVKLDTAVKGLQVNGADNNPKAQAKLSQLQNVLKQACSLFMNHTSPNVHPVTQSNGAAQINSASSTIKSILLKLASNNSTIHLLPEEVNLIKGMAVVATQNSQPVIGNELEKLHAQGIVGSSVRQYLIDRVKFYEGPIVGKEYDTILTFTESVRNTQAAIDQISQILGTNPALLNSTDRLYTFVKTELDYNSLKWSTSLKNEMQAFLQGQPASTEVKHFLQTYMKQTIEAIVKQTKSDLDKLKADFLANAIASQETPGQTVRGLLLKLNGINKISMSRAELLFINAACKNSLDVEQAKALENFLVTEIATEAIRAYLESALLFYEGTARYLMYVNNINKQKQTDWDKKVNTQIQLLVTAGGSNAIIVPNELRYYLIQLRNNQSSVFNANPTLLSELDLFLQQPNGSLINTGQLFPWLQAEIQNISQRTNQADVLNNQINSAFIAPVNPAPQGLQRAPTIKVLKQIMVLIARSHGNLISFPAGDISWIILNEISKYNGNIQLQTDLRALINNGMVSSVVWGHFAHMLQTLATAQENTDYQNILKEENILGINENVQLQLETLLSSNKPNVSQPGVDLTNRLNDLLQADASLPSTAQWGQPFRQEITDLLKIPPTLVNGGALDIYLQAMQQNLDGQNKTERTRLDKLHQQFIV